MTDNNSALNSPGGWESPGSLGRSTAEALLKTLDEHVIVAVTDAEGIITYANRQFCEISQFAREELVGKTHRIVNSGYHPASFWKAVWDTVKAGESWKGQVCNRAKDGSHYWVQTTIHPIVDEKGRIERYVAFRTDISAQKQVENKLRTSQMHLQEASRVAKVGSWEWDLAERKLSWSWTTKMIHEVAPDFEPDLETAIEFYPEGPERERIEYLMERAVSFGESFDEELQIRTAGGKRKWVRTIGQSEMVGGQCVRLYGVFQDIDQNRKLLDESERTASLLRSLVDSATEFGLIATDPQGIITLFNAGAEKLLGYEASELVGKETPAVIHLASEVEERAAELSERYGERIEGFRTFVRVSLDEGSEQREWTYVRKDGTQVPVALVVTPMRGKHGEITGFLGISRDLSAQRKAENELSDSEERFRRSFEYSGIGMAIVSLEGKWIQVNQSLLDMLGYEREELLQLTFQDITHPDDLNTDLELLQETLAGKRQNYAMEKRYFDSKGEIIWIKLNVSLVCDVQGRPIHFVSQIENISESKQLAREMKEVGDRLELAVQAGGIGIWDLDIRTGNLIWDDQMFALYGVDKDRFECSYADWRKAIHPEDVDAVFSATDDAKKGIREFNTNFRVVWPNGTVRHLRALATVQRDERGEPVRMVGTNWDVTDVVEQRQELERMAEQAEEASRAKSQFLANMSHEIRTPINGVIGMTSLLIDSPGLNSEQLKQAQVIQSSGEALLALINDILDFSKIEAGKLDLEILDFDLRDTLDDLNALLALRAREKNLEFTCRAENRVPDRLTGDPARLRQILLNLAGNAIKFTSEGKVEVFVSLQSRTEREVELRFSVRDTGIGISEAKKENLFSEFTQADSSTTRLYGGTGLGLAISKQLVDLMEGEIAAESELGSGSEFWFTVRFPYKKIEYKEEQLHQLSGKSALVVSRDESVRGELLERLGEWKVKATDFSGVREGLEFLRQTAKAGEAASYLFFDPSGAELSVERLLEELDGWEGNGRLRVVLLSDPDEAAGEKGLPHLSGLYRRSELYNLMVEGAEPERRQETALEDSASKHFSGRDIRILVAEDNVVNQMVVRGILGKFGIHADTVANGLEALEALQRIPYDLVLMDVQMPELDGLEASRRIRSGDAGERAKSVPIIALTAHARPEDKQDCLNAGMSEYVSKPVAPKALFKVLDLFLPDQDASLEGKADVDAPIDLKVFDRSRFISGMMDDEMLAREIAELSLVDFKKHGDLLEQTFRSGSLDDMLRAAHSIKGVSAHAYCLKLNWLSAKLEEEARKGNEAEVREGYAELAAALEEGMAALQSFLDGPRA
ncbi:PAS domain S-box protein [Pelagicoccus sp. SDUM812005]|uniref:PAS domain S-box protein n=1 Tax=Pelagicoccus sp. SDUM812005 TaxID=3041257 RepID=UPI00280CC1F3|nr:PAS domain S-box protein [Pelagicoccus sp. SDUM812005]MDQ8181242.1 PAS domain S-box protein [Pelagicoccus sp. SDUM812005]